MARLNFPPHIMDKVLNHVSGTIRGVAAVYNRFEYLEERRAGVEGCRDTLAISLCRRTRTLSRLRDSEVFMRRKTSDGNVPSANRGGAARFDYTQSQWKKIEEAVQAPKQGPLLGEGRERLRNAAQEYLSGELL